MITISKEKEEFAEYKLKCLFSYPLFRLKIHVFVFITKANRDVCLLGFRLCLLLGSFFTAPLFGFSILRNKFFAWVTKNARHADSVFYATYAITCR